MFKQTYLCCTLFLLSFSALRAQDASRHSVGFSGDAGFTSGSGYITYRPTYTFGVNYDFRFFGGFSFQTGVRYKHTGYSENLIFGSDINPKQGVAYTADNLTRSLTYIEVPLILKYSLNLDKFVPFAGAGVCMNKQLNSTLQYTEAGALHTSSTGADNGYYNFMAAAGLGYKLCRNWNISAQYILRKPFGSNAPYYSTFNHGAGLSAFYTFGKK